MGNDLEVQVRGWVSRLGETFTGMAADDLHGKVWEALSEADREDVTYAVESGAWSFDGVVLDAYAVGEVRPGRDVKAIHHVTLLLSFGGPNVWCDVREDGSATFRGAWWGESFSVEGGVSDDVSVWCNDLAATCLEDF